MNTNLNVTTAIIIPSQPGWFIGTVMPNETALDKEPIIAWSIEQDDNGTYSAEPITFNPVRNDVCTSVKGHVLCDPHGNYVSAYDPSGHPRMKGEEEAVKFCLEEDALPLSTFQTASKYETELKKRLDGANHTREIVEWYLKSMAADTAMFGPTERKFWEDIIDLYLLGKERGRNFSGIR